jgi:HK97 family phage portal protein
MMLATIFGGEGRPRVRAGVDWRSMDWPSGDPGRWFESFGTGSRSDAGVMVSPDVALTVGVVYRAINVLAHAVATVPLVVFRNLENDGKERDTSHPQYRMLHDKPNGWQTSFAFRHLMVSRMILWGNFQAQLVPSMDGAGQLVPLDPDPRITRIVDQLPDGRLIYVTRFKNGRGSYGLDQTLLQDDVLHVRGFSKDGKQGIPLTEFARNAMGLALAAEKHGSMFMRRGAQFSGILSSPTTSDEETRKYNEAQWNKTRGGLVGSGGVPLLEGDLKFQSTTSTNKDSQWLESRDFQIAELGPRFLGVPGLLCGYPDKTATYASAQEMRQVFVDNGVMPLTDNIRAELNRSVVIGAPDRFHADFILEGLLRGDIKTRYEAHQMSVMTGWKSRAEVRKIEGDNPGPPELDEFFEPLNLGKTGDQTAARPAPPRRRRPEPAPPQDDSADEKRMREIVAGVALGLVRKEVAAIAGSGGKAGAVRRFARDPEGWRTWLAEFYGEHAKAVSERLRVPWDVAESYCSAQRAAVEASAAAVERFEAEATPRLVAMTTGGRP